MRAATVKEGVLEELDVEKSQRKGATVEKEGRKEGRKETKSG